MHIDLCKIVYTHKSVGYNVKNISISISGTEILEFFSPVTLRQCKCKLSPKTKIICLYNVHVLVCSACSMCVYDFIEKFADMPNIWSIRFGCVYGGNRPCRASSLYVSVHHRIHYKTCLYYVVNGNEPGSA